MLTQIRDLKIILLFVNSRICLQLPDIHDEERKFKTIYEGNNVQIIIASGIGKTSRKSSLYIT